MRIEWIFLVLIYICESKTQNVSITDRNTKGEKVSTLSNKISHETMRKQLIENDCKNLNKNKRTPWFKFKFQELLDRNLIFDWPVNKRPVKSEYVFITRCMLMKMGWIVERYVNEKKSPEYFFKNEKRSLDFQNQIDETDYQIFQFEDGSVTSDLFFNSRNNNGTLQINAIDFFYYLIMKSHPNKSGESYWNLFYRFHPQSEFFVNGTFREFAKINYNQFPSDVLSKHLYVASRLLDYHFQKSTEEGVLYDSIRDKIDLKKIEEKEKMHFTISTYEYTEHIGRFKRFPENMWLLFIRMPGSDGQLFKPYRIFAPGLYDQGEMFFYSLDKKKVKSYFELKDDGYLKIFKKTGSETIDAKEVWISNKLLAYLKKIFPTNKAIQNFATLPKISHEEMVIKMCKLDRKKLTRVITTHILIDYSPFLKNKVEYQLEFDSALLLRWTCFSLNEENCIDKTLSLACRYLLKNENTTASSLRTTDVWPLERSEQTETLIPMQLTKSTVLFTGNNSERFFKQFYPNAKFIYSTADRAEVSSYLQVLVLLTVIFIFIKCS